MYMRRSAVGLFEVLNRCLASSRSGMRICHSPSEGITSSISYIA
jgi:hypothetical protein